ncbi:DUF4381 domain-containing protein [Ruegeria conchae]|uniref:Uncharacterized protein DUF4381 n=1 Tax=Ruegeria conchae TaxID=981384 RepID=A0A498A4D8_9RHOB|nr:DUF4381 domain-containing protein [Ruegeria conchae]RLK10676.1 uncharacterized protein DUF4381 [Ruegeria conchae]
MSIDTTGKSLVDLLDMLEPAPKPETISMMPQTWGWVVVAVILLAFFSVATVLILRHRRANAYRRYALAELASPGISVAKVAEILRRTALAAYPREQVAGIHGEDWLSFLSQTIDRKSLNSEVFRALVEAPYKDIPPNPAVTQLARHWVKAHKPYRRK